MVSFNLREEPVVFVGLNHDYVPYSPRDPSSLKGNIANHGVKPEELADNELKIREEVKKLQKIVSIAIKELIFPVLLPQPTVRKKSFNGVSALVFHIFCVKLWYFSSLSAREVQGNEAHC